jgi:hypothetical protein
MLQFYLRPKGAGKSTSLHPLLLDNQTKIDQDAEIQRRFSTSILFNFFTLATLNKLLGSSDAVNDLKVNFVHTLYTPSKILFILIII